MSNDSKERIKKNFRKEGKNKNKAVREYIEEICDILDMPNDTKEEQEEMLSSILKETADLEEIILSVVKHISFALVDDLEDKIPEISNATRDMTMALTDSFGPIGALIALSTGNTALLLSLIDTIKTSKSDDNTDKNQKITETLKRRYGL